MTRNKILFIFSFLLNISIAFSQPVKDFTTMKHVYEDWRSTRYGGTDCITMFYKESVTPAIIDSAIKKLSEELSFPVNGLDLLERVKPFSITKAEQIYLISELKKLKFFKWPDNLFPQSQKVKPSDLNEILVKRNSLPKAKSYLCSIVYSFSKPIYIRNKTVCLYMEGEQYSESFSQSTFRFYKIDDKKWREYADLYGYFHKEVQDKPIEDVGNSIQDTVPLKSVKLAVFAKKVFIAFKNQQIDTLINLIPTFDEKLLVLKSKGISAPEKELVNRLREADQNSTVIKENWFKDIIKAGIEKNIDLTKAKYGDFEGHEAENTLSLKQDAKPFIITSLDIFFYYDNRRFVIKIPEVYNLEGKLKIYSAITINEIK